jgi:hypothetical protein
VRQRKRLEQIKKELLHLIDLRRQELKEQARKNGERFTEDEFAMMAAREVRKYLYQDAMRETDRLLPSWYKYHPPQV